MTANLGLAKILQKMWRGSHREEVWPFLDPWDVVGMCKTASVWNFLGKYGPRGELFFLSKKKPFALTKRPFAFTKAVPFRPFVTAETLKACALLGR